MSLEKGRLWGDWITAFQYLKGSFKKEEDRVFNTFCCDKTKEMVSK